MVSKIWICLLFAFAFYTAMVYAFADSKIQQKPDEKIMAGWDTWQAKNCQSCHQIYGLGGYMGPDLTNTASAKGAHYMRPFIQYGTGKMPNFHLNKKEVNDIIAFLTWVDKSGRSKVPVSAVHWTGTYQIP